MMDKLLKVAVITWAAFLALLAGMLLTTQAAEPETFTAPVKVDRPMPTTIGEDPDEDALITAALEDQGYFRADVPLDYELQDVLHTAAQANGVPYPVALGLIYVESRFDPEAVSPAGCRGLCQLHPRYFPADLTPAENIEAGMEYLGSLIERYGDLSAALCGYHDGHDTGRRGYSNAVLEAAGRWK